MNDIDKVQQIADAVERAMALAALVSRLFAEEGWRLVVVGGAAIEFYTEGAYMSGDIDLCRRTVESIPLRKAQDIMSRIGATGGPRSWLVGGLYVDLLGLLENEALTPCRQLVTPLGEVTLIPPELLIVERTLQGFYPAADAEAKAVAGKLLAVCLTGATAVDWGEVERLAKLPSFNIVKELGQLREEVLRELESGA